MSNDLKLGTARINPASKDGRKYFIVRWMNVGSFQSWEMDVSPGATPRIRRNMLFRLISTILSNLASSTSRQNSWAILVAALLTRMSMRPNSRVVASTRA